MMNRDLPWGGVTELPAETNVYRAVLRERYIKNGIRYKVFTRRDSDDDGISIYNASSCTKSQFCGAFDECYGVLTLQVGDVRDLGEGLDVTPNMELDPRACYELQGLKLIKLGYGQKRIPQRCE